MKLVVNILYNNTKKQIMYYTSSLNTSSLLCLRLYYKDVERKLRIKKSFLWFHNTLSTKVNGCKLVRCISKIWIWRFNMFRKQFCLLFLFYVVSFFCELAQSYFVLLGKHKSLIRLEFINHHYYYFDNTNEYKQQNNQKKIMFSFSCSSSVRNVVDTKHNYV